MNYNCMRKQWTAKGNRDAGSSCSCVRELHRYLRNFGGGGLNPPSVRHWRCSLTSNTPTSGINNKLSNISQANSWQQPSNSSWNTHKIILQCTGYLDNARGILTIHGVSWQCTWCLDNARGILTMHGVSWQCTGYLDNARGSLKFSTPENSVV